MDPGQLKLATRSPSVSIPQMLGPRSVGATWEIRNEETWKVSTSAEYSTLHGRRWAGDVYFGRRNTDTCRRTDGVLSVSGRMTGVVALTAAVRIACPDIAASTQPCAATKAHSLRRV